MFKIKTHTPIKSSRKFVRINDEYSCEIIYFHNQLYKYTNYVTNEMYEYESVDFTYDKTHYRVYLEGIDVSSESLSDNSGMCTYKLQYGPNTSDITDGEGVEWERVHNFFKITLPDEETIKIINNKPYDTINKVVFSDKEKGVISYNVSKNVKYGKYDFRNYEIVYEVNDLDDSGNTLPMIFNYQYNYKSSVLNVEFSNVDRNDTTKTCNYLIYDNYNEILDSGTCTWDSVVLENGITESFSFGYNGVYKPTIMNTKLSAWEVINKDYYSAQTENSHYLVFRRNGYEDFSKEMTNDYPLDTYGTSLLLVKVGNKFTDVDGTFQGATVRWNYGEDCFAKDLGNNYKIRTFSVLKDKIGITNEKFKELFNIWEFVIYNINKTSMDLPLEMNSDYCLNLNQEDLYNNTYCEKVINENINSVIDYEKRQFVLSYLSCLGKKPIDDYAIELGDGIFKWKLPNSGVTNNDENLHIANSLTFDLYFRERSVEETTVDSDGVLYNDYGAWETNDSNYWFDLNIEENGKPTVLGGDLLGNLGFTDDDVLYQKDCLKKSFLRLSIYDSPYRETQKLLYYSTLFFDTNVLYKKYVDYYHDLQCTKLLISGPFQKEDFVRLYSIKKDL